VTTTTTVLRAALTVGSLTMLSRLTGFARDVMIAATLGAGTAADAFFVSFKLANCLRRLFAEGAFGAGFVPFFARTAAEDGEDEARRMARGTASVLLGVMLPLVLLAELAMPWLVRLLATGFEPGGGRYELAVELSRITFPYLACLSVAALAGAVLNARGRFAAAAATPVLLNLTLISALALAAAFGFEAVWALAWGVAAAGLLQASWLLVATARLGFPLLPGRVRRADPRLRRLLALTLPGMGGAGLGQVMLLVNSWSASHLPAGAVAHLFYADRLVQLPIGLVGVALGTALLPALSGATRAGDARGAAALLARSLSAALLLALPAAAGLLVLADPIIAVLYERGAFGPDATAATAATLRAMAVGLPAAVLAQVLAPAHFAAEDTRTPVRAAAGSLLLNVALIPLLIGPLAEAGIALAGSVAAWAYAGLLAFTLPRAGRLAALPELRRGFGRAVAATTAMVALILALRPSLAGLPGPAALALLVGGGGLAYLLVAAALGALRDLRPPSLREA
jgi:putative peptidoglycan lipid II flippase